eukprot:329132_1
MLPRTNSGGGMVGNVSPGCTGSVLGKDIKGAGLITPPSLIEWNGLRFLVMDAPRPSNVHLYLKRFLEYNVSDLVCVCERTYDPKVVMAAGIKVHEMKYDDGSAPPEEIISRWLEVWSMPLYVSCCPPLSPILLLQLPRTISIPPCSGMHTGWGLLYHVHTRYLSCS